jgi:hypothetical protein
MSKVWADDMCLCVVLALFGCVSFPFDIVLVSAFTDEAQTALFKDPVRTAL